MEIWKGVLRYPNYEVSNLGMVRNAKTKKILKQQINWSGYHRVFLYNDDGGRNFSVHRLVISSFKGDSKLHINHIDGNKGNNSIDNLEWCTHSENMKHSYSSKLRIGQRGESHGMSKLTVDIVSQIKAMLISGMKQKEIALQFGIDQSAVSLIGSGKRWSDVKPKIDL